MTYDYLLKNFKCPQCKRELCHPRFGGNYYCFCNSSYLTDKNQLYLFFNDNLYIVSFADNTCFLYFKDSKHHSHFFHYDSIPDWILNDNAQDVIEGLLIFL